jgi:nucleotide-binding universal stress UspA family protein
MFEKIVVPLDGSSAAEAALPYVAEIAATFGSHITLIRVCSSYDAQAVSQSRAYLKSAAAAMGQQLEAWQARSETEVKYELRVGVPAVEIVNYAGQTVADLIAIASRGESNDRRWPLGTVAAKVLRSAGFPTLLIRKPAGEGAIQGKRLTRKILAPLDGSTLGEAALPLATALATNLQAELVLLRVVESSVFLSLSEGMENHFEEIVKQNSIEYVNEKAKELTGRGPQIAAVTLVGAAADQILDYAKTSGIDLIVMPSHGRSGIGRWVFGSVTDKVLHAGDTPVLVVRTPSP